MLKYIRTVVNVTVHFLFIYLLALQQNGSFKNQHEYTMQYGCIKEIGTEEDVNEVNFSVDSIVE